LPRFNTSARKISSACRRRGKVHPKLSYLQKDAAFEGDEHLVARTDCELNYTRRKSFRFVKRLSCITLNVDHVDSRRSAIFRQTRSRVYVTLGFLLLIYIYQFFLGSDTSAIGVKSFRSAHGYHARGLEERLDRSPLSTFLESNGLDNSRTIFLTIASKEYIEQMVNFRTSLAEWKLGNNYVVLCLDVECLQGAKEYDILAYDGYIMTAEEAAGDWHIPVARLKVHPLYNKINDSLPPTLTCWTEGIISSSSTATYI